jgi:hypothetical protein
MRVEPPPETAGFVTGALCGLTATTLPYLTFRGLRHRHAEDTRVGVASVTRQQMEVQ